MTGQSTGFRLPYTGQAPAEFFLPLESSFSQTLARLCVLAEPVFDLGFSILWLSERGLRMAWRIEGHDVIVGVDFGEQPSATLDALRELFARLNQALEERGRAQRVELVNAKREAYAHYDMSYWVTVCTADSSADPLRLPEPEELIDDPEQIIAGSPYASGLAALASQLAGRVLEREFDIHARGSRRSSDTNFYGDESHLPITFAHARFHNTVVLEQPHRARGALGVIRELQQRCDLEDRAKGWEVGVDEPEPNPERRKPYWLCVAPAAEHVVLANTQEATELRRHGYLREGETAQRLWCWLTGQGTELPAMAYTWLRLRHSLHSVFVRVALMQPKDVGLEVEERKGEDTSRLVLRLRDRELIFECEDSWDSLLSSSILRWILRRLNAALEAEASKFRAMHLGSRLVWLPTALVGQVLCEWPELGCQLEEGFSTEEDFPWPVSHPPSSEPETIPTAKRPEDIAGEQRVLDSDFKCSARSEDYPDVFDELAAFAGVADEIKSVSLAQQIGDSSYRFRVARESVQLEVVVSDSKYADVTPMVDVLNRVLAERGAPRRLYLYNGPGWEGGVVLASEDEADVLRMYHYI